jgi:hypothetical protein
MNRQRGVSLSGLLVAVVFVIFGGLLAMKVAPSVMEYYKIVQAIKSVAADGSLKTATVADVRRAFAKHQEIGYFTKVGPADIEVTKEGGELVVGFAYQDKIPLFANVSLVIDYEASSLK